MAMSAAYGKLVVSRDYPAPSDGFVASEDVLSMYYQYEGLLQGKMPCFLALSKFVASRI